jgi:hypothetical protein
VNCLVQLTFEQDVLNEGISVLVYILEQVPYVITDGPFEEH